MHSDGAPRSSIERLRDAAIALEEMRSRLDRLETRRTEPIAMIGMSCRFPGGANDQDSYWQLLSAGRDATSDVPGERWDVAAFYDPDPERPGRAYCRRGGFLDVPLDQMDPAFFGISGREASEIDPQQRLLLEVAWEAIEDAAYSADRLKGSDTAVFVGITHSDYMQNTLFSGPEHIGPYSGTGTASSVAAGRLSYVFGLTGPAMMVDTACSTSLVAIHLAMQSLRNGDCRMALAGAANIIGAPEPSIYFAKLKALSADGRCKAFDAAADGYARGEGCGIVVLKRLSDARADGDRIAAVLRGSAVNHDGRSSGLTAPNGIAQENVIRAALDNAGLAPGDVDYIEAHGTGTPLGDPIEVNALARVFGCDRPHERPIVIGSVKTNIGHLEMAAGVAGLIKVVLALRHGSIPPHIHFSRWNPHIDLGDAAVAVALKAQAWPRGPRRRIAGVSAFGISGTNAHVIVEEAPAETSGVDHGGTAPRLLALSAKSPHALRSLARRYRDHLTRDPDVDLDGVSFTTTVGRAHFPCRAAGVTTTAPDLVDQLTAIAEGSPPQHIAIGKAQVPRPQIAFMFTGQGSQYAGMGRELYRREPVFRHWVDKCDALLQPHLSTSITAVLFPDGNAQPDLIDQTAFTQPALFTLAYALAQLWLSWGVRPDVVIGHSVGEYVAACIAGALRLEDGLMLIARRGALMQSLPRNGAMASIRADRDAVQRVIASHSETVSMAALQTPGNVVISGRRDAVESCCHALAAAGASVQLLNVSHAFHSALLDPILDAFRGVAAGVAHQPPSIRLVSNLTGNVVGPDTLTPDYWVQHARQPVRFCEGLTCLAELGCRTFVEVGPSPTLCGFGREIFPDAPMRWLPSLQRGRGESARMLASLAELYVSGCEVDWPAFQAARGRRRIALPTYPFERERYWKARRTPMNGNDGAAGTAQPLTASHPLLGRRLDTAGRDIIFEIACGALPACLGDHRVRGRVLYPASAYSEMALAAARRLGGEGTWRIEALRFEQVLDLTQPSARLLQVVLSPQSETAWRFEICSSAGGQGGGWRRHAWGRLTGFAPQDVEQVQLQSLQKLCPDEVEAAVHYDNALRTGFEYGPAFRSIDRLWLGASQVLACLRRPAPGAAAVLNPVLVDGSFQSLLSLLARDEEGATYLPAGIEEFVEYRPSGDSRWCHAKLLPRADDVERRADLRLFDDDGRLVALVRGLTARKAGKEGGAVADRGQQELFHQLRWVAAERPHPTKPARPGTWLILTDRAGYGRELVHALEALHENVLAVAPPADEGTWSAVLDALPISKTTPLRGVVHLPSIDCSPGDATDATTIERDQAKLCDSALELVQLLLRRHVSVDRLWFVTAGAQAINEGDRDALSPIQALLWGLGRVVANEWPELRCSLLDLDGVSQATPAIREATLDRLMSELLNPSGENQIAWRRGTRWIARLAAWQPSDDSLKVPSEPRFALQISPRGTLDKLHLVPVASTRPGPGEVSIRVKATGLNFRDVLNALDMYPGEPGPLGSECAGEVLEVGQGVDGFVPGLPVMALCPGSFTNVAIAPAAFVCPIPSGMDCVEAATIPVAFLTAYYALVELAQLRAGETVLIHAAAGGVGQAAVKIARQLGAKVFATAGNARKRAFLEGQGIACIMDSRVLDFCEEVRAANEGRGVDVVLNCLTGESIARSLSLLEPAGRFVEIGKAEIWSDARVADVAPGVRYLPVALDEVAARSPELIATMFGKLAGLFEVGGLEPLPYKPYSMGDAVSGFRFMQQARHVGKIVITSEPESARLRADRTYLITGGTGALGLQFAAHFVFSGARHIVLAARHEPSATARAQMAELERQGARVDAVSADVADAVSAANLIRHIETALPPLAGIVHASGILDDGILLEQSAARFAKVLAPKVMGTWNLHSLTRTLPLDFFVLFSSASSVLGSPGQSGYAAANAFLDAFAQYRAARGWPALSVNWGPWAGPGMAADTPAAQRNWSAQGLRALRPAEGLAAFDRLSGQSVANVMVMPVDWRNAVTDLGPLLADVSHGKTPPLSRANVGAVEALLAGLATLSPSQRAQGMSDFVAAEAARILNLSPTVRIEPLQSLWDLGLDSLMAVELRNVLAAAFARPLPATVLFDYPTPRALAAYIMETALEQPSSTPADTAQSVDAAPYESGPRASDAFDELSEDELERELLAELDEGGY
jgi:acyl transferase domain-containing protein/NADPH:quinone reductase-like Zn-dependent oxidoreductase/nucleoside-diphosphate-sugar epimerase/acyl carrier protein